MRKYKIPVNIVFSGYVEVKAADEEEATQIAIKNFEATLGRCGDNNCDRIVDWGIEVHGNTEEA